MIFQTVFPDVRFYAIPFVVNGLTRHNWFRTAFGIDIVMNELSNCGQFEREDISKIALYSRLRNSKENGD